MKRHPLIPKPERRDHLEICFVCGHKILGNPVAIALSYGQTEEQRKYRHIRCEPGSDRWMASEHGKKSDSYEYFKERTEK